MKRTYRICMNKSNACRSYEETIWCTLIKLLHIIILSRHLIEQSIEPRLKIHPLKKLFRFRWNMKERHLLRKVANSAKLNYCFLIIKFEGNWRWKYCLWGLHFWQCDALLLYTVWKLCYSCVLSQNLFGRSMLPCLQQKERNWNYFMSTSTCQILRRNFQ